MWGWWGAQWVHQGGSGVDEGGGGQGGPQRRGHLERPDVHSETLRQLEASSPDRTRGRPGAPQTPSPSGRLSRPPRPLQDCNPSSPSPSSPPSPSAVPSFIMRLMLTICE